MDEHDWLAERFEENRPPLRAVAYRVLGSASDPEHLAQLDVIPARRSAWLNASR